MTPTREWLAKHLDNLENSRFYGKVTLSFEAGNITTVKKEETLKPPKDNERRTIGGYQPHGSRLDPGNPPRGGSGVPR